MKHRKIAHNIFEVVYWVGGSEVGEWRRTLRRFEGRHVAITSEHRRELSRMGYPVKILRTRDIERHGLPETRE